MPVIIRDIRGIEPKVDTEVVNTKSSDLDVESTKFTEDDRKFLDALKEFYTLGKSDLLDSYHGDDSEFK